MDLIRYYIIALDEHSRFSTKMLILSYGLSKSCKAPASCKQKQLPMLSDVYILVCFVDLLEQATYICCKVNIKQFHITSGKQPTNSHSKCDAS